MTNPQAEVKHPRGRAIRLFFLTLLFCALFAAVGLLICRAAGIDVFDFSLPQKQSRAVSAQEDGKHGSDPAPKIRRVVIDAGHGGEDGGAQSAAGLYEKDVNLAVALFLRDLLEAADVPVVLTRTEDKLLYDPRADYAGRKKVLDLAGRRRIAEAVPDSLFLSIHMNAFPQEKYSGLQVWYSPADAESRLAAERVQDYARRLDPLNHRRVKAAGSSIYLLDRLDTPAILVECGFLSNPTEAARLAGDKYRQELAFILAAAVLSAMNAAD